MQCLGNDPINVVTNISAITGNITFIFVTVSQLFTAPNLCFPKEEYNFHPNQSLVTNMDKFWFLVLQSHK